MSEELVAQSIRIAIKLFARFKNKQAIRIIWVYLDEKKTKLLI